MRTLVVNDIHGNKARVQKLHGLFKDRKFDYVLVNGDVTNFQGIDVAEIVLSTLSRLADKAYFVPGNCDPPKLLEVESLGGAENVHGRVVELKAFGKTVHLAGLGGSTVTPFNTWIEYSEEEVKNLLPKPKAPFILMSHAPPYNTKIDVTWAKKHVGSRAIREYILMHKPILGLHAHIHEARGDDTLGGVKVVNPGPLANGYFLTLEIKEDFSVDYRFERV